MAKVVEEPAAKSGRGRRRLSRGAVVVGVLGIVFLLVGLNGGSYQGKLPKVEKNDNTAFLPNSAQSTKVDKEAPRYQLVQALPGFVVYQRPGGLTPADRCMLSDIPAAEP